MDELRIQETKLIRFSNTSVFLLIGELPAFHICYNGDIHIVDNGISTVEQSRETYCRKFPVTSTTRMDLQINSIQIPEHRLNMLTSHTNVTM